MKVSLISVVFWTLCVCVNAQTTGAATARGTVAGTVYDAVNGRPIPNIQIAVDGIADGRFKTDSAGRYTVSLSPGTYTFKFAGANHIEAIVTRVVVKAGEVVDASTVMQQVGAVTTVEVNERIGAVESNAESILTERKLASTVSDSISKEDIKNSTASDAAAALEKVTGISVVDNGFVFVRGLGERYSSTMLNNAIIPTTEPERRVVPLDLFPANLVDNIKVLKTYSADLPGEFSGGLVQMNTVEFPNQKILQFSVNYGFNTQTTFQRMATFRGGAADFFGFGGGSRELPAVIPRDDRLFVGRFTDEQFQAFGRAFPVDYEPTFRSSARPQQSYSVVGGNTYGKLGVIGALTFANTPSRTPQLQRFLVNSGTGRPALFSVYDDFNVDNESARLGGVLNLAYRLTSSSKLVLRNTLTRDADKEARQFTGLNGSIGNDVLDTRFRYVERSLYSTSLEGDHAFAKLRNSVFHWQFTYSDSRRNEPDLRQTIRGREPGTNNPFTYLNLGDSGFRFFNGLKDRIYEPQADWSIPFYKGNFSALLKGGFRGTVRRRDFNSRRFRFVPVRLQTLDFSLRNNEILSAANIRPDGFVLREVTRATDTYAASMDIYGVFGMVDLNLGPKLRLVAGVRMEDATIDVNTLDALVPNAAPVLARLANRDALPGVNVIYALSRRQNLRGGYSRTVNRPDFRELSPFEFTNIVGGYSTVGNPDLRRALIDNYDVRYEFFPGGNQVIAASYFYKRFTNPIEQTYRPTASELRQSFINVDGAKNQGVELEWRQNLAKYSKRLQDFAFQTNFTFVNSDVIIPVERFPQLTSRNRPLVGQSRFIYNAIVEWTKPTLRSSARFYSNSVSRRITDVGTFQLPDIYQERNTFLDAVYQFDIRENGQWTLRLSAENLTNNNYRYTQSDILIRSFRIGRTFTIGTSYSFF
jgi:outer membrane receptor protein involved in Fe transport